MEYKNEKDFVCRTKHNLALYRKHKSNRTTGFDHEVTQLINSFLGLILFIKEKGIRSNKKLNTFIESNKPVLWTYKYPNKQGELTEERHDFKNYLRHLRNAVAHPDKQLKIISEQSQNNEIQAIKFIDIDKKNRSNKFETTLSLGNIDQLIELLTEAFLADATCAETGEVNG